MKERLHDRLHAPHARKVRSKNSSVFSSNCSTVKVHEAGSSAPRGQEMLSHVSHSARARVYASSSGRSSLVSSKPGGVGALPTSRKRAGEADRDRRGLGERRSEAGTTGGVPGVNRSARHEQQVKDALQPAQGWLACAQTRTWAICQGSRGRGAG